VDKRRKRVALMILCATLGACSRHVQGPQDARVSVQTSQAVIRTIPEVESAIGSVGQGLAPIISAPIGGQLTRILVVPGQSVRSQQRLARLRPTPRRHKAQPAEDIRAPGSGVITQILAQVGAPVRAGTGLFGFAGPHVRQARLPFPLSVASQLHIGESVLLHSPLAPRSPIAGVIVRLDRRPSDNVVYVIADLPPRQGWTPGSPVRADVVVGSRPALLVPRTSVAFRLAGTVVFVVDHRQVRMQRVKIGPRFLQDVVITQGLAAGTVVVTDAGPLLADGTPITVVGTQKP